DEPFAVRADGDEAALEAEHGQEVHEIALDVAQAAQVVQFFRRKAERAEMVELPLDFFLQLRQRIGRRVAAGESGVGLRRRMVRRRRLPHRELVEVRFEQAADDGCIHAALSLAASSGSTSALVAQRTPRAAIACRKAACCASKPPTGLMQSVSSTS